MYEELIDKFPNSSRASTGKRRLREMGYEYVEKSEREESSEGEDSEGEEGSEESNTEETSENQEENND